MFTVWVVVWHLLDDGSSVVAVYANGASADEFVRKNKPAHGYYEVVEKELMD
jgi:hypothetical protein